MSRAESAESHGQEEFSIAGERIGGPKNFWKRITTEAGTEILAAWEFINEPSQNGNLNGYTFRFPQESLADIYIEDSNEQKVFTAMGKDGVSLDSRFKVSKIQLYLHSREWEENHKGQWVEWKNYGTSFERTNNWYPIGITTRPKVETPIYEPPTTKKQKNINLKKWALAAAIAFGGLSLLSNALDSTNDYQQFVKYETLDLKPGETWIPPDDLAMVIIIPPESSLSVTSIQSIRPWDNQALYTNPGKYLIIKASGFQQEIFPIIIGTLGTYKKDVIIQYDVIGDLDQLAKTDINLVPANSTGTIVNTNYLSANFCLLAYQAVNQYNPATGPATNNYPGILTECATFNPD